MNVEPRDDGMLDGALLVDAMGADSRKKIAGLFLDAGRLVMVKNGGDHFTVHYMFKSSGLPQWRIDFWTEQRTSSITDTMEHARQLAEEFMQEGAEQAPRSRPPTVGG